MRIVHVVNDAKFAGMAAKAFEATFPGCNTYVSFSKNKCRKDKIEIVRYSRVLVFFGFIIKNILKADVVVFHSMGEKHLLLLRWVPVDAKVIWIGWGYDYYDLIGRRLLKDETLKADNQFKMSSGFRSSVFGLILRFLKNKKLKWIRRVNIFSPVIREDFDLVKRFNPKFAAKYSSWNYGTLEDDHVRGFEGKDIKGNNILLGNSASDTNNHLDAFSLIKNLDLKDRKVITPLSYGDDNYRDLIITEGQKALGSVFEPLTEFMPIDDYISVLQSCSVVVMNHLRQQALGNIVIALYMGAKVFLDEHNPVYEFFTKQGAFIFKLDQLEQEYLSKLSGEQVAHNREVLKNYWSRDVILNKTKKLVEQALSS